MFRLRNFPRPYLQHPLCFNRRYLRILLKEQIPTIKEIKIISFKLVQSDCQTGVRVF